MTVDENHPHPRSHGADRLRDPQRLHLVLDHDHQPGRGRDRRGARRQAGHRLRLLLQRPLCAGRHPARALHSAHPGGRPEVARSTRSNDNLDPVAVWKAFMANEKPGGHGDRAHAAGALDMAVWDAVAKIAEQAAVAAAVRALQRRPLRRDGARLSGRRLLLPRQGARRPQGRDARLPGAGLQGRQDEDRRRRSRHRSASASRP